jgi:orotidine-5'-phosphate decarboxylase
VLLTDPQGRILAHPDRELISAPISAEPALAGSVERWRAAGAPLEPAILTVHASGGRAMLEDAKAAASDHTKVVGVTVLTSLDSDDLAIIGINDDPAAQVARLSGLAHEAGLDGIVCSGHEVKAAHQAWRSGFFVVPGVRPAGGKVADQKRIVTPAQAINDGASILVIGRPISQAEDPVAAVRAIEATL